MDNVTLIRTIAGSRVHFWYRHQPLGLQFQYKSAKTKTYGNQKCVRPHRRRL
jgi:hypothetical protein